MYFLLKMGIFHCYVSLPESTEYFLGIKALHVNRCNENESYSSLEWGVSEIIANFIATKTLNVPLKTNMTLENPYFQYNRKYIFKWWIFQCHVSFRGGSAGLGIIVVCPESFNPFLI